MSTENQETQNNPGAEKRKLTDKQLRIAQVIAGLICAAALAISIFVASLFQNDSENTLLQYLFLIVFLVIMVGRRQIERRFRLRLNLFSITLMVGIGIAVLIYTAQAFYAPSPDAQINLSDPVKILILAGIALLIVGLGIIFPYMRYRKRREEGTLAPLRIPEPEEVEEEETEPEDAEEHKGLSPIERQIMEMTRELDGKDGGEASDDTDSTEK